MTMDRNALMELVKKVYLPEVADDIHWWKLIAHRPVAHLRAKGYTVTVLGSNQYKVEGKPLAQSGFLRAARSGAVLSRARRVLFQGVYWKKISRNLL